MKLLPLLSLGLVAPVVAQNRIHVDAAADPGGDGTTWATAYASLRDAIAAANASAGDDEIWVASGTYTPDPTDTSKVFQLASGVAIYGGFANGDANLGDRNSDPTTNGTVLSGDLAGNDGPDFANRTDNSSRVVDSSGADATAILDGFTISGGNAASAGGGFGGSGSPTVRHCRFTDNRAFNASGATGGAVALPFSSSPQFFDCLFSGNFASTEGGAIDLNGSTARFLRCQFTGNVAGSSGGAVKSSDSAAVFSQCSFAANLATKEAYNGLGSGSGGAMYIRGTDDLLLIHNCSFSGNSAYYGGAIYLYVANPVLTNLTITGNRASTLGGGIHCGFYPSAPVLTNCLIWNNASAGSTADLAASISVSSSAPNFTHCIVEHSGGSGGTWDPTAGVDGGNNLDDDPGFTTPLDPLTAPSTAGDFTLGTGSPAIDAGLDTADLDGPGSGTDTIASVSDDLGGNPRIEGSSVDIGAYEYFEGGGLVTFGSLFPALNAADDDNGNGLSNFLDYASGADPTAPHDPAATPSIGDGHVTFSHRAGASDVNPVYQKSSTLSGWTTMQPNVDYNVISTQTIGDRIEVTLDLLIEPGSDPRMFFREEFPEP